MPGKALLATLTMIAPAIPASADGPAAAPYTQSSALAPRSTPPDKNLDPAWLKSLAVRGEPEVWKGEDLKWIGMPVGGLCAGQIYLGGDGKLWHWDIFNQFIRTVDGHYASPMEPTSPLEQGFSLTVGGHKRALDRIGFRDITFRGEYPIGRVEYADPASPVTVSLEAFSPFIPLDFADSSLPATILTFTLKNRSDKPVEATLAGELENAVCLNNRLRKAILRTRTLQEPGLTLLECSAEDPAANDAPRPEIIFEDWSAPGYEGWSVEGNAFGHGPIEKTKIPGYQGNVGGDTPRVVNSHATAPGNRDTKDDAKGKLTSREFLIERNAIAFWIGGGEAPKGSSHGLRLLVDGKPVRTASGKNLNAMEWESFDVSALAGKKARIEITDDKAGIWGNIGVGRIVFTDALQPLNEQSDHGTMALALVGGGGEAGPDATAPFPEKLSGSLAKSVKLPPGGTATITFVLAWHFPNLSLEKLGAVGRSYAARFDSAPAVARYVAANLGRLTDLTRLWRDNWYDSTLPYWFLDRTMLNNSILASSTCYRFKDGRFYGWEGVGSCEGTCTHVWQYAQGPARLFPELERDLRERVDFGLAMKPDGAITFRGELNDAPAVDGQAGVILRALREHRTSPDNTFLARNWPDIQKAMGYLLGKDPDANGLLDGPQHNTLDTDWFGKISWLSGLFVAALRAAAEMADDMGDSAYAAKCRAIADKGTRNLAAELFDGEYFINLVDPAKADTINSGTGCHIDQVFGQSWAWQVGIKDRVFPREQTLAALEALWKYNFTTDAGAYRKENKPGRWYAMDGEAGLIMCTFPRTDWSYDLASGKGPQWAAGYFNECMNGFEYQVAGHMIQEGMVEKGLALTRAVHDRYSPAKRNPYNEIECGDHYARSMAAYGVFLAACGFDYDGPEARIGFAPRISPENFRAAFTSAEGWGSYAQTNGPAGRLDASLWLRYGNLTLKSFSFELPEGATASRMAARVGGNPVEASFSQDGRHVLVTFSTALHMKANNKLTISLS